MLNTMHPHFPSQAAFLETSGDDSRLHAKVFRCLGSWFNITAVPQEHVINSKLLAAPFEILVSSVLNSLFLTFIHSELNFPKYSMF